MSYLAPIAQSGLQVAQLRLGVAAHNVANMHTPGFVPQRVQETSAPALGGVQAQVQQGGTLGVSLAHEVVEQIAAVYTFKANALVLRIDKQLTDTTLDLFA